MYLARMRILRDGFVRPPWVERRGSAKHCLVRSNPSLDGTLGALAPYAVAPEGAEKAGIARAGNSIGTKSRAGER